MWTSAAGAHLLQSSTCYVFKDDILHTVVVTGVYLRYILNQSTHFPLTNDIYKAFSSTQLPLTGYFLFSDHSLSTLEMVVCENPSRSAVSEILRPVRLEPPTIPRSKSLKSLSSPF